jgi:hypothetical protein
LVLRILAVCGLRPAEVLVLRIEDFEGSQLRIDEALKERQRGDDRIGATKTAESDNYVPVPPDLGREIEVWIARHPDRTDPRAFLFPNSAGTAFGVGNFLKRYLKPLAEQVGVKGVTFQAFRRTSSTHIQNHATVKDMQRHCMRPWRAMPTRGFGGRYSRWWRPSQRTAQVEGLGDLRHRYKREQRSENPVLQELDRLRMASWTDREEAGFYLRPVLRVFLYWDPRIHHELPDFGGGVSRVWKRSFSLSANRCVRRFRQEHEDLTAEFNSLLAGVEQSLTATGMVVSRMNDDELFLELKRALNPLLADVTPLRRPAESLMYRSAREQAANTSIEDEQTPKGPALPRRTAARLDGTRIERRSVRPIPDARIRSRRSSANPARLPSSAPVR